ncbi:MAG: hypothetical protein GX542_07660 [Rhodococcus sp.]|nr:hypothetical protein [Rhodococcus sp. (in: high G+C Gram-positive bacteria)]
MTDGWSYSDTDVVAGVIAAAPSVYDSQPWDVRLIDRRAEVRERTSVHCSPRADLLISCGAAVTNLEVGLRALGRNTHTDVLPDPTNPELLAVVESTGSSAPNSTDLRQFSAISRRRSHRRQFADIAVPADTISDIVAAAHRGTNSADSVFIRVIGGDESAALAETLTYSAKLAQHNVQQKREVFPWTSHWNPGGFETIDPDRSVITQGVPDTDSLAAAIESETVLVFSAHTTTAEHLIRLGMAVERAWLTAVDARLCASVLTHPLRVEDAATRLAQRLSLAGEPQLLMRIGYRGTGNGAEL